MRAKRPMRLLRSQRSLEYLLARQPRSSNATARLGRSWMPIWQVETLSLGHPAALIISDTDIRGTLMLLPSSSANRAEAQMLRSILAELFSNWVKRHAIREQRSTSSGSLFAFASLQRKIKMADKQNPAVKNPETPGQRSAKADLIARIPPVLLKRRRRPELRFVMCGKTQHLTQTGIQKATVRHGRLTNP